MHLHERLSKTKNKESKKLNKEEKGELEIGRENIKVSRTEMKSNERRKENWKMLTIKNKEQECKPQRDDLKDKG